MIGLLREREDGPAPEPPQPTLEQIPALVEESRSAGPSGRYRENLPADAVVPVAAATLPAEPSRRV